MNYFTKWVLPVLLYLGTSGYMLWKESQKVAPDFVILYSVLLVVAVIFIIVFKKQIWSLADEVLDGGDHLIVRFGTKTQNIPFTNIIDANAVNRFGATTVTLRLSVPCDFGNKISFLAKSESRNPFASNPIAEGLLARIEKNDGRVV